MRVLQLPREVALYDRRTEFHVFLIRKETKNPRKQWLLWEEKKEE
jgi:hypothetical protein